MNYILKGLWIAFTTYGAYLLFEEVGTRIMIVIVLSAIASITLGWLSYVIAHKDLYIKYRDTLDALGVFRDESERILEKASSLYDTINKLESEKADLLKRVEEADVTIKSLESVYGQERKKMKRGKK